jgi:hypothetical protein
MKHKALRPDSIDNLLTRGAFYKSLSFAENGELDRVSYSVLQVIVSFFAGLGYDGRICAGVYLPASGKRHSELKHAISKLPEGANRKNFT